MTAEKSLVPVLLREKHATRLHDALVILGGAVLVALLAQVKIMLPFTPVPITGQTFGVALVGLFLGGKRGAASITTYLLMGTLGLPVFAGGVARMLWGPTIGYRFGMLGAAYLMGWLADRGWATDFKRAWAAGLLGSAVVFASGLAVLSYFVPSRSLLAAGLMPFLAGDLIKTFLAAGIVTGTHKLLQSK
jgi:biotin transport system substrate-specific component